MRRSFAVLWLMSMTMPALGQVSESGCLLIGTFAYDSDVLMSVTKRNLDEVAKALRDERLRTKTFFVEGHADARGSEPYNQYLSERRAQAVVRYLTELGTDPSKLVVKGYGKSQPKTNDPYEADNRRVELRIDLTNHGAAQSNPTISSSPR
jgi:outer membrane protein OmpA-like peptidoglycan-associated protein